MENLSQNAIKLRKLMIG